MRPVALIIAVLALASAATAHGPSVRLSYGSVAPAQLAVRAGQTVHFHNASATPRTFTVRAEGGTFESPPLARGEGYHHEFTEPGSYPYRVAEFPDMQGLVIVAPAGK